MTQRHTLTHEPQNVRPPRRQDSPLGGALFPTGDNPWQDAIAAKSHAAPAQFNPQEIQSNIVLLVMTASVLYASGRRFRGLASVVAATPWGCMAAQTPAAGSTYAGVCSGRIPIDSAMSAMSRT
jgi:hypothetical protein